ncbi:MAG: hypothetical protein JXR76_00920 [Deltaproteobacteria bacterium]|nr:hypothetical protein [Deltaproteobacteria bacterium]
MKRNRQRKMHLVFLISTVFSMSISISGNAAGQVFSPGKLSNAHAQWDSLNHCDKCHTPGQKIDRQKCLTCHRPLAERIRKQQGFHGQKQIRKQRCEKCHPEHRGQEASLVDWTKSSISGAPPTSKKQFDHLQTGWPLKGAHAKAECADCHQSRRIKDAKVLAYLKTTRDAETFQGLSTACIDCHFDEHRGQLKAACDKCHTEKSFKPVSKFTHDKYWKLEGAHKKVPCIKCHLEQTDATYSQKAFPKPRAATYLKMNGIPHDSCTDCHTDAHHNRFGKNCLSCHNVNSWVIDTPTRDLSFHNRTDFPLLGRHRFVPCERCHPRNAKGNMKLTPIAHERCNTCHPNAHPDFSPAHYLKRDCGECHTNGGFAPSKFTLNDHQKTKFPLSAPHQTVACPVCHLNKMGQPVTDTGSKKLAGFTAKRVLSKWRLISDVAPQKCDRCHASPHRSQFAGQQCTNCHNGTSWRIDATTWQHEKHSTYALKGRHKKVACAKCHLTESDLDGTFVRYRPIDHADCTPCHGDHHLGQFRLLSPKKKCSNCHEEKGFAPSKFDHNNPAFCTFPLRGKHLKTRCIKCHPRTTLADGVSTIRYRPTLSDCDLCHADEHRGAFSKAATVQHRPNSAIPSAGTSPPNARDLWGAPKNWFPPQSTRTDCSACHKESGWHDVQFDHSQTTFPLKGHHRQVPCDQCHKKDISTPLPLNCVGCHEDVHRGSLGANCAECHNEEGFRNTSPAVLARHNRTRFPLVGRHAALPCTECHRDANGREFQKVPTQCVACHAKDIPAPGQTSVDHSAIHMACDRCHTPVSWKTAAFEGHDRCFPIGTFSKHGSVSCTKCHQGAPPSSLSDCSTGTFSCRQCHGCQTARHRGVPGYACEDRRCYECHRNP